MDLDSNLRPLILLALVAFVVYANSLGGDFVYDDTRQILRNPLIQDSKLYGKALASDVWAFKGDGSTAASNYYRPTFVAWLILNFRLFGAHPFGWHVANLILHIGVCLLAFALLRRWKASAGAAFAVALLFAVHPVHAESVAWISGSPDLLFSAAFLASLLFADRWTRDRKLSDFAASLALYVLALGAKEIALFCFPVYFLIFNERRPAIEGDGKPREKAGGFLNPALNSTAIFAAAAALFFLARWMVLGRLTHPVEDATDLASAILSAPGMFVFYFKQMIFPLALSVNYPLRPVSSIGFADFLLPLAVSVAVLTALWLVCRKSFLRQIGALLLLLPLLPVLNAASFPFDQIVHDRYLYLPLLGFLLIVFSFLEERLLPYLADKSARLVLGLAVLLSVALGLQTFFYNRTWKNNLALWSNAARIDPQSTSTLTNYAAELSASGRIDAAVEIYNRSVGMRPTAAALMGRARNLAALKRFDEARSDLETVVTMPPESLNAYTLYQSYEALALVYANTNGLEKAEEILRQARGRLPIYAAALTEKLAVVLYQKGDKTGALGELEAAQEKARAELLPESKTVFLRLGMLYLELGRRAEARRVLQEYLILTANLKDNLTLVDRQQAVKLLGSFQ